MKLFSLIVAFWLCARLTSAVFKVGIPPYLDIAAGAAVFARATAFILDAGVVLVRRPAGSGRLAAVGSVMPKIAVKIVKLEIAIYKNFWRSLFQPVGLKVGFTMVNGSRFQTIPFVAGLSLLVEIPIFYFIFRNFLPADKHGLADFFVALLTGYAIIFLRADRFAISQSVHVLTASELKLHLGFRLNGTVSLHAIKAVIALSRSDGSIKELRDRHNAQKIQEISPSDRPNVLIICDPDGVALHHFIRGQIAPDVLAIYVDKPAEFINKLHSARLQTHHACQATT